MQPFRSCPSAESDFISPKENTDTVDENDITIKKESSNEVMEIDDAEIFDYMEEGINPQHIILYLNRTMLRNNIREIVYMDEALSNSTIEGFCKGISIVLQEDITEDLF